MYILIFANSISFPEFWTEFSSIKYFKVNSVRLNDFFANYYKVEDDNTELLVIHRDELNLSFI